MSEQNIPAPEYTFQLEKAHQLIAEGKLLHAIQILLKLTDKFPEYEGAVITLVSIYDRQGNKESAIAAIYEAIENAQANMQLRLFAGHYFFKQQLWQHTIDVLGIVAPEEEPLCAFFCAYAYFMQKDYKLAKHYFLIYLEKHRSAEFAQDAYVYLCKISIHLEEFQEALDYVKKAEEYFNGHYELHLLYGIVYYYLGMFTHALDAIERAIQLNEGDLSVFEWAGKISIQCQRFDKAEEYLRHYSNSTDNMSSEVYAHLGLACLYNMKAEDAKQFFDLALKLNPAETVAIAGLKKMNTDYYLFER